MLRGKRHPVKDIRGNIYGKLKVIDFKGFDKRGNSLWLCKCSCGSDKEIIRSKSTLNKGGIKSCGCLNKNADFKRKGYKEITGGYWCQIRHAHKGKIKLKITPKYAYKIFQKQNRKCALSGIDIFFVKSFRVDYMQQTAGLDRIDSNKPYEKNNIQWIHKDINTMKWNFSEAEFIDFCKLVSNYRMKTSYLVKDYNSIKISSRKRISKKSFNDLSSSTYISIKYGAIKRKIDFNISIEDIWNQYEKQDRKCYFTGLNIHFEPVGKYKILQTASVDRLDNKKPYNKDNIVIVHKKINFMKYSLPESKFIEYCYLIAKKKGQIENIKH